MAYGVYLVPLGIELNLTLPDLGHPEIPDLWEQIYPSRKLPPNSLQCLECLMREPDCPEYMYLRIRDGRREAVHYNPSIGAHRSTPESAKHRALKERIAQAADRAGFRVQVEDVADHGRRRTDVRIDGDGLTLGCEVQISPITAPTVTRRSQIAADDGITPLWVADDPKSAVIHQAPWAVIPKETPQRIAAGTQLLVQGGARHIEWDRCGRRHPRCPETGGRPCGQLHGYFQAARGVHLDRLVVEAAAGEWRPIAIRKSRGRLHYWIPADDYERYYDSLHSRQTIERAKADNDPQPVTPRELDRRCRYGQDTGYRSAPAANRDNAAPVFIGATLAARTSSNWLKFCDCGHSHVRHGHDGKRNTAGACHLCACQRFRKRAETETHRD